MTTMLSPTCPPPWCDLPADLLEHVMSHLPFPADRARFRAVCHAWHAAAAREHARRGGLPWIVMPDASFCTIGDDGVFFDRIPGLPENVTCLGGASPAGGGWLALDCTDAVHRRTSYPEKILTDTCEPRRDVKHRHTYLLHNPFSNATVALPELDAAFGNVSDEFEIRKVLMMKSSGGDGGDGDVVVAVTTNSYKYSVVVCRPGKGMRVVPDLPILDIAFLGDTLYAMTVNEDVIEFDLAEDGDGDGNGRPAFVQYKRVIRRPLADGEEDLWSWMDDDDDESDGDDDELSSSNDGEEEEEEDEEESNDDEAPCNSSTEEDDVFDSFGELPDTETIEDAEEDKTKVPNDDEPKDYITTARYLVASSNGEELLMVRHHRRIPPFSDAYTVKVEVFRGDLSLREWVPVAGAGDGGGDGGRLLASEALFLSRSFSKSTPAYGGVQEGFMYFVAQVNNVFDTRCWVPRTFSIPWQRALVEERLLTWLFPPELVV